MRTQLPRRYKGITIDKAFPSGLYRALVPSFGFVRADTLEGVKSLINQALKAVS